jgi:integrase
MLATFAGLRWGELTALRRDSIDLDACEIRITETTVQLDRGGLRPGTPKSLAGRRTVAFPDDLVPELRRHLDRFAQPGPRGLVFVGPKGAPLRRTNFRPIWVKACAAAGAPGVHFHDLRHTGGTLAATTGATTKELMARLGHSSPRAAMIYQHATRDRDQAIARALGTLARQAREDKAKRPKGKRRNRWMWPVCGPAPGLARFLEPSACLLPGPELWSGRRESNPHDQLGRLGLCH